MIEVSGTGEVSDVQVQVPHNRPRWHALPRCTLGRCDHRCEIERVRGHQELTSESPPFGARAVPIHLDSQSIRIGEIERLTDQMVTGTCWCPDGGQVSDEPSKRRPVREQDGEMIEPQARTWPAGSGSRPFLEQHQRLVGRCCPKRRAIAHAEEFTEPQHPGIPFQGAVQIGDLEMDGPEVQRPGKPVPGGWLPITAGQRGLLRPTGGFDSGCSGGSSVVGCVVTRFAHRGYLQRADTMINPRLKVVVWRTSWMVTLAPCSSYNWRMRMSRRSGCRCAMPGLALLLLTFTLPGPSRSIHAQSTTATSSPRRHTVADVAFMQGMIGHHAQALEMAALVPGRSSRPEMEGLAERIIVSQRDEIAIMRSWLRDHGEAVPPDAATHGEHAGHNAATPMPGMLSPAQMDSLRSATGAVFDRLFLQYMIQHHEGALVMVADLLRTPGAAQEPMVFQFMSDVDADQRAEIRRMKALLTQWSRTS